MAVYDLTPTPVEFQDFDHALAHFADANSKPNNTVPISECMSLDRNQVKLLLTVLTPVYAVPMEQSSFSAEEVLVNAATAGSESANGGVVLLTPNPMYKPHDVGSTAQLPSHLDYEGYECSPKVNAEVNAAPVYSVPLEGVAPGTAAGESTRVLVTGAAGGGGGGGGGSREIEYVVYAGSGAAGGGGVISSVVEYSVPMDDSVAGVAEVQISVAASGSGAGSATYYDADPVPEVRGRTDTLC